MSQRPRSLEVFDPAILSSSFANPVTNAAGSGELDYLCRQLARHLFCIYELSGEQLCDAHGLAWTLVQALGLPRGDALRADAFVESLSKLLGDRPHRRVAIIVTDADALIGADMQRYLTWQANIERVADHLASADPRTQLLLFLTGPASSFPPIDLLSKQRADQRAVQKVLPDEIEVSPWSNPQEFEMTARHDFVVSHAEWYFLSRGHRSGDSCEGWHCVERDDRLLFIRAADGRPAIEGVFARTSGGMKLIGICYEGDPRFLTMSQFSEDPFTLFRRLCQSLGHWQTTTAEAPV